MMKFGCFFSALPIIFTATILQPANAQQVNLLVLYENKGHHLEFTNRAVPWLKKLSPDSNFAVEFITDTKFISKNYLKQFNIFIQLDYVPYGWSKESATAFEEAIQAGSIGWIGLHHAYFPGAFNGYPMWNWFSDFMGGIRYRNYIADFAAGTVHLENSSHPIMHGGSDFFTIAKEEWYIYN